YLIYTMNIIDQLNSLYSIDELKNLKSPNGFFRKYKYWYRIKFGLLNPNIEYKIPYNLTDNMKLDPTRLLISLLFIIDATRIKNHIRCLTIKKIDCVFLNTYP